ncbi:MAG: hypothetical protein AAF615_08325 [Pseudomonadota bacterium]
MFDDHSFCFRVFAPTIPSFLATWRAVSETSHWERHYLVAPGHELKLRGAEAVILTRNQDLGEVSREDKILEAGFPLDWMALKVIADVLPRSISRHDLDGTSAQSLVDCLAHPELAQASVHVHTRQVVLGSTLTEISRLSVPDWKASSVALTFKSRNAHALRAVLAAAGLSRTPHETLAGWLQRAHQASLPPPPVKKAVRPFQFATAG